MFFQRVIGNYLDHIGAEAKGGKKTCCLKVFPF